MRQLKALQTLQASGKKIFSSSDLHNILRVKKDEYLYVLCGRLLKEGVLERIAKGYYSLASNPPSDFELANALCWPSYVSLDSALNFYGILTQSPQVVTSLTTKRAASIRSKGRTFSYSHINRKYFSDYHKVSGFLIATPEKALVDAAFFMALGKGTLSFEELDLGLVNRAKVRRMASRIRNRAFRRVFKVLSL
jgi:predicted transcriptional regulator of viral defense system